MCWEVEAGEFLEACGSASLVHACISEQEILPLRRRKVRLDTLGCPLTFMCTFWYMNMYIHTQMHSEGGCPVNTMCPVIKHHVSLFLGPSVAHSLSHMRALSRSPNTGLVGSAPSPKATLLRSGCGKRQACFLQFCHPGAPGKPAGSADGGMGNVQ